MHPVVVRPVQDPAAAVRAGPAGERRGRAAVRARLTGPAGAAHYPAGVAPTRLLGVPEPVTVRVPAKVNLHLSVGPAREDGYHELVTVFHAISLYDEVTATPARDLSIGISGEGAGELSAGRGQPGLEGRGAAGRAGRRAAGRPARPGQGHPGGRRAGRRQRRRGRDAGRLRRAVGHRAGPGRAARAGRRAGQRRRVRADRRHRAGHRPGRAAHPGARRRPLALGARGRRRGPVHPGRVRRARPAAGRHRAARGRRAGPADQRAAGARPGRARPAAGQRPAGRRRWRCGRSCAARCGSGSTSARSARSSPAPGRPARSCPGPGRRRSGWRPRWPAPASAGRSGSRTARCPAPGWSPTRKARDRPARLAGERVQGVRDDRRARRRLARRRRRRADRRGRPQRRRQDHAAAPAHRRGGAGRRPGHPHRRPRGSASVDQRTDPRRRRPSATPSWPAFGAGARVGRRRRGPRGARRARAAPDRPGRPGRADCPAASAAGSRWPRRWSPAPTCWCSTSRPTTSTSRASPGWPSTCKARAGRRWSWSPTTAGSSTRSASRPGRSATARCRRYDGGYSAYVLARAERARQAAAYRGPPAEPAAQGAGLAAPRPAGPDQQAAVPDRGRPGADRRRAAAAGLDPRCRRSPPAGSARPSTTSRTSRCAVGDRTLLDDVTWRLGPGDRVGVVGVNGAGKTTLLRLLLGEHAAGRRPVGVGQTVRAGYLSQDVAELPAAAAAAGGGRGGRPDRPDLGDRAICRVAAGRAVRLRAPAGSGPRSPTCPAASGAGCSCCGC